MENIEEFSQDGKDFIYIDFSGASSGNDLLEIIEKAEQAISRYPQHSVYTITNLDNVRFDSNTKEEFVRYMKFNRPFVKYGVVIGIDGIKKIMAQTIMKLSGRSNLNFCFTREEAVNWLLRQE